MRPHGFLAGRKFCEEFIVAWINKKKAFAGQEVAEAQAARLQFSRPDVIWGSGTFVPPEQRNSFLRLQPLPT
jgi:hypothetical protein